MYRKFRIFLLLCLSSIIVCLGSVITEAKKNYVLAAPVGYHDLFTLPYNYLMVGVDISSTLWFDTSVDTPIDETNTQAIIHGPGYDNVPFLRSYSVNDDLLLEIFTGSDYLQIWHQQHGWSFDLLPGGYYQLGAYATNLSIRPENSGINTFCHVASLGQQSNFVPVLAGWEGIFFTNVNQPVSTTYVKSLLQAFDNEDGDLSTSIVVASDGYTSNRFVLGQYPVVFSVTDSSNNQATLTIYIRVIDATSPIINGPNTVNSSLSTPLTTTAITSLLSVSDNYDTNLGVSIKSDNYSANKMIVGSYDIIFEACDSSGNKSLKTITVQVIDDIKPMISGESNYTRGSTGILSENTIRAGLQASDNVDGNITNNIVLIQDNYSSKGNKAGSYTLTYQASDSAGNTSDIFTVYVTIQDNIPPVFYVNVAIIHIDNSLSLTHEQIIALLVETGQIEENMQGLASIANDNYQGTHTPGIYQIQVEINNPDGSIKMINLTVKVVAQQLTVPIIKPWYQSWDGWLSKWFGAKFIWDFIVDVTKWIF